MPIATRAKLAAVAAALLVTALIGAPAFAIDGSDPGDPAVHAFAKPTQKPKPSHPHATPVPTPVATPRPTPAPTPRLTPKPNATAAPEATAGKTDRPRKGDASPKPSRRPSGSASPGADVASTPRDPADGLNAPGAGSISGGPSPGLLGLATFLAAMVGLGTLWVLTRRRRRRPGPALPPVAARVQAAPARNETWTNVRLDDDEALPEWLRLDGEPERAQLAHVPPRAPLPPFEPVPVAAAVVVDGAPAAQADPAPGAPARAPQRFDRPLAEGAMRLALGARGSDLRDQPNEEVGVVLATLLGGDEVEIQDLEESWVRVLTPLGTSGWIRAESVGFGPPPGEQAAVAAASSASPDGPEEPPRGQEPRARRHGLRLPRRTRSAEQPS
jgi:hypothetical protein